MTPLGSYDPMLVYTLYATGTWSQRVDIALSMSRNAATEEERKMWRRRCWEEQVPLKNRAPGQSCPDCGSDLVDWNELNWSILHPFSTEWVLACFDCGRRIKMEYR